MRSDFFSTHIIDPLGLMNGVSIGFGTVSSVGCQYFGSDERYTEVIDRCFILNSPSARQDCQETHSVSPLFFSRKKTFGRDTGTEKYTKSK